VKFSRRIAVIQILTGNAASPQQLLAAFKIPTLRDIECDHSAFKNSFIVVCQKNSPRVTSFSWKSQNKRHSRMERLGGVFLETLDSAISKAETPGHQRPGK
jgi:hypothetical protein